MDNSSRRAYRWLGTNLLCPVAQAYITQGLASDGEIPATFAQFA